MSSPAAVLVPGESVQGQADLVHPTTSQPQVIMVEAPFSTIDLKTGKQFTILALGNALFVVGGLCLAFQFGALVMGTTVASYGAPGVLGGVFYMIAGWLGVSGAKHKLKERLVGFLAMSIIGSIVALCCLCTAAVGTAVDLDEFPDEEKITALNAILTLLSVSAFFVTLTSVGVSCATLYCRTTVTSTCTVQYVNMTTDHTHVAQPSTVIMQPVDVASNQQVVHSTQQWTSVGQGSLSPPPPAPQPQCTSPGDTSTTPTGSITTVHVSVHPTP